MDADLYDEFGNYIGPDLASDDDDEASPERHDPMVGVLSIYSTIEAGVFRPDSCICTPP